VRSRNIYTSSIILTACYYFTSRERFYGDLISPAKIKLIEVFVSMARHFCRIFYQIYIFSTDFDKSPQHQTSRKSIQLERCWYMWTDGRTDKRKLIGAFRDYETVLDKVNLYLFLNITPVGNEAASIYKLITKWRQDIIFARSLQVSTGPRSSRPSLFRP